MLLELFQKKTEKIVHTMRFMLNYLLLHFPCCYIVTNKYNCNLRKYDESE